ncbi:MAG: hypothetical protein GF355_03840 [Candidatus Eisenbacteria bacterium]|nr:hypothetical protein [Candidatus Eisenbacteria bacterium]
MKAATNLLGAFAEALALDQLVDSSKAQRELDRTPQHKSFLDDVDLYLAAWRVSS